MTRAEGLTLVEYRREADVVRISSDYAPHVRRMRARAEFAELGVTDGLVVFEIPRVRYDPLRGRTRSSTPSQRPTVQPNPPTAVTAENLARLRAMPPTSTLAQIAAHLGVSVSSAQRLRRARREELTP